MAFLNLKYLLTGLLVSMALLTSAQHVVMKYDANMMVQGKDLSGLLIQSATDSSNRFIFVSKLGLKFFDVEVGKADFSYTIHYFSPAFKSEKRVIGVAKEMFVLAYSNAKAQEKGNRVRFVKSKAGSCKTAFGWFGKRVRVCYLDYHTTVQCRFYPVKFDLRVLD